MTEPKPPVKGELLEDVGRVLNDARKYMGRGYLGDHIELYERIGNVHRAVINASRDVTTPTVIIPAADFGRIEGLETAIKRRAKGWYSLAEIADQGNPDGTFQRDNDLFYQAAQKLDTLARKYGSAE